MGRIRTYLSQNYKFWADPYWRPHHILEAEASFIIFRYELYNHPQKSCHQRHNTSFNLLCQVLFLAGTKGFEPLTSLLESDVLPIKLSSYMDAE